MNLKFLARKVVLIKFTNVIDIFDAIFAAENGKALCLDANY
jgi:hypothetical protein